MKATEELAWLNEVSSVPLQFSRNRRQSAEYTRSGIRYRDGALFLAKMDYTAGVHLDLARCGPRRRSTRRR